MREHGIPVETFGVTGSDGRRIAAYRFGDPSIVRSVQLSGRTVFSAKMKSDLVDRYGARCNIYLEQFPERELQIDHRIPFEIAGEGDLSENLNDYMLLCPSANRAKSWSCENCENWINRQFSVCRSCYWAYPEEYSHVAMRDLRRLDIMWTGEDTSEYDILRNEASEAESDIPQYVKNMLRAHFEKLD